MDECGSPHCHYGAFLLIITIRTFMSIRKPNFVRSCEEYGTIFLFCPIRSDSAFQSDPHRGPCRSETPSMAGQGRHGHHEPLVGGANVVHGWVRSEGGGGGGPTFYFYRQSTLVITNLSMSGRRNTMSMPWMDLAPVHCWERRRPQTADAAEGWWSSSPLFLLGTT